MIRKSILAFIALSFFSVCFAGSIQDAHKAVIARKNTAACSIPVTANISFETNNESNTLAQSTAEGQTFSSGAGGTLAKICVNIDDTGTNGTISLRLDDDDDMTSEYTEDLGTSATISSDGWVCFESVTNPVIPATTTYYIGIMMNEAAGLKWFQDSAAGYADGSAWSSGTAWNMGTVNVAKDENFRVYYCE